MIPYLPNYQVERTPPTWGSAVYVLSGLLLVASAPGATTPAVALPAISLGPRGYNVPANTGTYSQLQNMFTGMYDRYSLDFDSTISTFYANLLAKQEPLGKEFEKVLYDNLWDLYVS